MPAPPLGANREFPFTLDLRDVNGIAREAVSGCLSQTGRDYTDARMTSPIRSPSAAACSPAYRPPAGIFDEMHRPPTAAARALGRL